MCRPTAVLAWLAPAADRPLALRLPVHAKYPAPSSTADSIEVYIPMPWLLSRCGSSQAGGSGWEVLQRGHATLAAADKALAVWLIPAGQPQHLLLVTWGTLAVVMLSAAWIIALSIGRGSGSNRGPTHTTQERMKNG